MSEQLSVYKLAAKELANKFERRFIGLFGEYFEEMKAHVPKEFSYYYDEPDGKTGTKRAALWALAEKYHADGKLFEANQLNEKLRAASNELASECKNLSKLVDPGLWTRYCRDEVGKRHSVWFVGEVIKLLAAKEGER